MTVANLTIREDFTRAYRVEGLKQVVFWGEVTKRYACRRLIGWKSSVSAVSVMYKQADGVVCVESIVAAFACQACYGRKLCAGLFNEGRGLVAMLCILLFLCTRDVLINHVSSCIIIGSKQGNPNELENPPKEVTCPR